MAEEQSSNEFVVTFNGVTMSFSSIEEMQEWIRAQLATPEVI